MKRDGLARVRAIAMKLPDVEGKPAVYYVTPHYKDYDSVLARVDLLSETELRELLESGHEFMMIAAKRRRS